MRPLTTTSYAILGVLAVRPWSAYDLTSYMRTSVVRRYWPRTEARLYAEPKNLVAHGLAKAARGYTGRRRRTVYSITDAGKRALAGWLGERAVRWETEDEPMLKILLSDHGTREQLLATIRWAMEDLLAMATVMKGVSERVVTGHGLFPERLHVTALGARHGVAMGRLRYEFLRWAEEWVRTWEHVRVTGKEQQAQAIVEQCRAELLKLDRDLRRWLKRQPAVGAGEVRPSKA